MAGEISQKYETVFYLCFGLKRKGLQSKLKQKYYLVAVLVSLWAVCLKQHDVNVSNSQIPNTMGLWYVC